MQTMHKYVKLCAFDSISVITFVINLGFVKAHSLGVSYFNIIKPALIGPQNAVY